MVAAVAPSGTCKTLPLPSAPNLTLKLRGFVSSPPFDLIAAVTATSTSRCRLLKPKASSCAGVRAKDKARPSDKELREEWLGSLSCPFLGEGKEDGPGRGSEWAVGVDPDASGAIAVLKPDGSAEVFDTPHLRVLVGKALKKRVDARSIVNLLGGFHPPLGTKAFVEQSIPFPSNGKLSWWCGGFSYGLWTGILVASGYSVVPVPSVTWKKYFELSKGPSTKDDSRNAASALFPQLAPMLKRKKDHGRAEALLIAAYGKKVLLPSCRNATEETHPGAACSPTNTSTPSLKHSIENPVESGKISESNRAVLPTGHFGNLLGRRDRPVSISEHKALVPALDLNASLPNLQAELLVDESIT